MLSEQNTFEFLLLFCLALKHLDNHKFLMQRRVLPRLGIPHRTNRDFPHRVPHLPPARARPARVFHNLMMLGIPPQHLISISRLTCGSTLGSSRKTTAESPCRGYRTTCSLRRSSVVSATR